MKKYRVTNLKTNVNYFYSEFELRLAFIIVFILGFICGALNF